MTKTTIKRNVVAIVICLAFSVCASAQLEFFDEKNVKIGSIASDGKVHNAQNQLIGAISMDGKVTDAKNQVIGNIQNDGVLVNEKGEKVAKLTKEGKVTNLKDEVIVMLSKDGKVLDAKNNPVGRTAGDEKTTFENNKALIEKNKGLTALELKNNWSAAFYVFFYDNTLRTIKPAR